MKVVSDISVPRGEAWLMETLGYRIERTPGNGVSLEQQSLGHNAGTLSDLIPGETE